MSSSYVLDQRPRYVIAICLTSHPLKPNSKPIADVEDQVKIVIQVAGMNTLVRPDPRDEDKILWYRQVRVFRR